MDTILQRFTTLDADNINKCSQNGITLLMYFCKSDSNIEYVKALLKNPYIKFNMKNNDGKSAYDFAIENGCKGIISLLNDMMKLIEEEEKFQIVFNFLKKNGKVQLLRHFCSFFDNKRKYFNNNNNNNNINNNINNDRSYTDNSYTDLIYFYQPEVFDKDDKLDYCMIGKYLLDYINRTYDVKKKSWLIYLWYSIINNNINNNRFKKVKSFEEVYKLKLIEIDDGIMKYKSIYTPDECVSNLRYEFHHLLEKNE